MNSDVVSLRKWYYHNYYKLRECFKYDNENTIKWFYNSWWSGITYGFSLLKDSSIIAKFDIDKASLQERFHTCKTIEELFDGLELRPGTVCGLDYKCWKDISDNLGISVEQLKDYCLNGTKIYSLVIAKYGTTLWHTEQLTYFDKSYFDRLTDEDVAENIVSGIKPTFNYDNNRSKKYFDTVNCVVSLVRISRLSKQETIEVVRRAQIYIQRMVREKICAHKKFVTCELPQAYLKCSNCTLTSQGELVYTFGWVADTEDY